MTGATLLVEVATLGLAMGLVLSLVCYLAIDISPGGMITPGWLAITLFEDYRRFVLVAGITVLTYLGTLALRRTVILYGKRLFAGVVLLSVLLTTTVFLLVQDRAPLLFAHQTLGFVVPGLITYQLIRQPVVPTVAATAVATGASYLLLLGGLLSGLVTAV